MLFRQIVKLKSPKIINNDEKLWFFSLHDTNTGFFFSVYSKFYITQLGKEKLCHCRLEMVAQTFDEVMNMMKLGSKQWQLGIFFPCQFEFFFLDIMTSSHYSGLFGEQTHDLQLNIKCGSTCWLTLM